MDHTLLGDSDGVRDGWAWGLVPTVLSLMSVGCLTDCFACCKRRIETGGAASATARRQRLLLHYARRTLRLSLTRIGREPPALLAAALPLETARAALREPPPPQDPAR